MINLTGLQAIANKFLTTDVIIRRHAAPAKDPSNPTGDDVVSHETATVAVKGWFLDKGTRSFAQGGGMSIVVDEPTLRLPVGTLIGSRDEVTFNGETWTVVDASQDETWPIFVKAELARIE